MQKRGPCCISTYGGLQAQIAGWVFAFWVARADGRAAGVCHRQRVALTALAGSRSCCGALLGLVPTWPPGGRKPPTREVPITNSASARPAAGPA